MSADPPEAPSGPSAPARSLIIACGALVREIHAVLGQARRAEVDIRALPATLHNRPEAIAPAVAKLLDKLAPRYARVFVAYADCGIGGALDRVIREYGAERLPGAHCYAFFSGVEAFSARAEADLTSFYLTDFLARQFEALIVRGLALDRHPELRDVYFAHYERLVYLSQEPTTALLARAEAAARFLGLAFEHRPVGYGDLARALDARFSASVPP
jgi:hypothetical protein